MKKSAALLAAAILPLVTGLGIATSSLAQSHTTVAPFTANGQSADATYCQLLASLYLESDTDPNINAAVLEAINQCNKGNTAAGIPVLEQALAYDKVTLPPGSPTP
jgi:hypothetical protein